eukprot:GFUD01103483.1.p1 GENE.GFUD01103483.1~~GFUD01103483.1.p1  ORF type:complete len:205 (-),score=45.03 GFUD01103483.1:328-942(-)
MKFVILLGIAMLAFGSSFADKSLNKRQKKVGSGFERVALGTRGMETESGIYNSNISLDDLMTRAEEDFTVVAVGYSLISNFCQFIFSIKGTTGPANKFFDIYIRQDLVEQCWQNSSSVGLQVDIKQGPVENEGQNWMVAVASLAVMVILLIIASVFIFNRMRKYQRIARAQDIELNEMKERNIARASDRLYETDETEYYSEIPN